MVGILPEVPFESVVARWRGDACKREVRTGHLTKTMLASRRPRQHAPDPRLAGCRIHRHLSEVSGDGGSLVSAAELGEPDHVLGHETPLARRLPENEALVAGAKLSADQPRLCGVDAERLRHGFPKLRSGGADARD